MTAAIHRLQRPSGACASLAVFGLSVGTIAWTADLQSSEPLDPESRLPNLRQSLAATSPERQPLNLLLTQAELRSIVREYEIKTGEVLTAPIEEEEILVTAPGVLAPMRDVSQDVWGGIAAPFWAVMNPKHAWRIFVPIPPKGEQQEPRAVRAEDR